MRIARAVLSAYVALFPVLVDWSAAAETTPAPRAAKPRVKMAQNEAEALVKEMSATVERIRGLKFKTPVTMQIIDGKAAREQFKSKIEPRDEEQMKYTQEAYVRLGLIPKDVDLLTNYLDLAEEGVDGYYEPGSKTFFLLDHVSKDEVKSVMVHELTHALEDQHYDLKAFAKRADGDDDRSAAISAVIEGSAMVVMIAYMDQEMRKGKAAVAEAEKDQEKRVERLKNAPSFTQRSLLMPYILGFSFLLRGRLYNFLRGGVLISDLDHAYKNPPMSTRHIIHPDLYWRRPDIKFTRPQLPDLSKVLGEGWKKMTEGSIGELGIAVLTGSPINFNSPKILLPESWSNSASVGTIGDVFQHYSNGEKRVTVLCTGWESTREAQEFSNALRPSNRRVDFIYGANHLMLIGSFPNPDTVDALASAAFAGAGYWPRDEGVGKWPPERGPEMGLD